MVDVIEARTQSDVVGKILKHIHFVFEALPLPARPPPPSRAGRSSGRWLPTRRQLLLIRFRRPPAQDLSFPAADLDKSEGESYLPHVFQAQFAEDLASGPNLARSCHARSVFDVGLEVQIPIALLASVLRSIVSTSKGLRRADRNRQPDMAAAPREKGSLTIRTIVL